MRKKKPIVASWDAWAEIEIAYRNAVVKMQRRADVVRASTALLHPEVASDSAAWVIGTAAVVSDSEWLALEVVAEDVADQRLRLAAAMAEAGYLLAELRAAGVR